MLVDTFLSSGLLAKQTYRKIVPAHLRQKETEKCMRLENLFALIRSLAPICQVFNNCSAIGFQNAPRKQKYDILRNSKAISIP